jgi:PilZ domain
MYQPEVQDARRSEPRISIDLGSTPFLGSRKNGQPSFAYLLADVSSSGVGLIVPPQNRMVPLAVGETVNFHLPFQLDQKFYNEGVVRWQQTVPQGQQCGANLHKRVPVRYPIYVAFETGAIHLILEEFGIPDVGDLVGRILEDAFYFKKGVSIYFEHLAPYFGRHGRLHQEKRSEEDGSIVPRIRAQIEENIRTIENLKNKAAQRASSRSFPALDDLESLRAAIPLEINLAVLSEDFDASVVLPYLRSVRLLEHQLYTNFNTLVLVHLQICGHLVVGSRERPH